MKNKDGKMNKYLIKGINAQGKNFEIVIIAECITNAVQLNIDDFIKEITSVEKI